MWLLLSAAASSSRLLISLALKSLQISQDTRILLQIVIFKNCFSNLIFVEVEAKPWAFCPRISAVQYLSSRDHFSLFAVLLWLQLDSLRALTLLSHSLYGPQLTNNQISLVGLRPPDLSPYLQLSYNHNYLSSNWRIFHSPYLNTGAISFN